MLSVSSLFFYPLLISIVPPGESGGVAYLTMLKYLIRICSFNSSGASGNFFPFDFDYLPPQYLFHLLDLLMLDHSQVLLHQCSSSYFK